MRPERERGVPNLGVVIPSSGRPVLEHAHPPPPLKKKKKRKQGAHVGHRWLTQPSIPPLTQGDQRGGWKGCRWGQGRAKALLCTSATLLLLVVHLKEVVFLASLFLVWCFSLFLAVLFLQAKPKRTRKDLWHALVNDKQLARFTSPVGGKLGWGTQYTGQT